MQAQNTVTVYIVILNWNGLADTLVCLESLSTIKTTGFHLTTLVIDNGSKVDETIKIKQAFSSVVVERCEKNLGFAEGCNFGIQIALKANADYILFLNNDTIVTPDFLYQLVGYMLDHPEVGVCGPLICYADSPDKVWFAGGKVNLMLGYFDHVHKDLPVSTLDRQIRTCEFVTGCCMLVSAKALTYVNGFDKRFFAYIEDVDLSLRIRANRLKAIFVPDSLIFHKVSSSSNSNLSQGTVSPFIHFLMARNKLLIVKKLGNWPERMIYQIVMHPIISSYYLSGFILRRRWDKLKAYLQGTLRGYKGLPL